MQIDPGDGTEAGQSDPHQNEQSDTGEHVASPTGQGEESGDSDGAAVGERRAPPDAPPFRAPDASRQ